VLSPGDTFSSLEIAYGSPHDGELRDLVHRLKYRQEARVGTILGEALGRRFSSLLQGAIFVPLPLHTKSPRNYNQALLLAQGAARVCGGRVWDCLYWQEDAAPQTGKNREERQKLSSEALGFFRDSRNSPCSRRSEEEPDASLILVDDVTTTGTTLKVAAEVLEKEGYTVSRGVVCCYAPPGGVVL
jgi:predicted amidophosphoribosyltransferase